MFQNNKKAKELSSNAKELLEKAKHEFHESSCQLNENLQHYIALRKAVTSKTLKEFDDTYSTIENVTLEETPITFDTHELESVDHNFYNSLEEVKEVVVEEVKSGSFGAFFKAALYSVTAFIVAVLVGIFASGSNIYLDKMPEESQLNDLLMWFGNIADPGQGDATKGALLLAVLIAAIVFIVVFTKMSTRAAQNLKKAEIALAQADSVHHKKSAHTQKALTLSEYALALSKTLKTLQVYMNEFNAIMQRIIHVEGHDFNDYLEQSKKDINMAVTISKRIHNIITTNIIAENGEITPETREALEQCKECLEEHTKAGRAV